MSREEEIIQAADECYPTWEEHNAGFCQGAKWADQNPPKGLWDAEKVMEYLNSYFSEIELSERVSFLNRLRKAMEE